MLDKTKILKMCKSNSMVTLPIYYPAPLIFSLSAATRVCVCLTHKDAFDWFYSNFILLKFNNDFIDNPQKWAKLDHFLSLYPLDYFYIGRQETGLFLKETILNSDIVKLDYSTIVDTVIQWIDKEYYVFAHVDVTKLSATMSYNQEPFVHTCFLYGYNKEKKCFNQLDFVPDGRLLQIETSFQDFEDAFCSDKIPKLLSQKGMGPQFYISLGKLQNSTRYVINKENIAFQLSDYLNSNNTHLRHQDFFSVKEGTCGLQVYDQIDNYIEIISKERIELSYKGFHALYEHKKIMQDRLKYYINIGLIPSTMENAYEVIVSMAKKLRFMALKYNTTLNTQICQRMLLIISTIRQLEKLALTELLAVLS